MLGRRLRRAAFQWVDGTVMAAGVLTKGRDLGHVDLLVGLIQGGRYQIHGGDVGGSQVESHREGTTSVTDKVGK